MDQYSILKYCRFETSRSSGPGGQHVNKTESRVTIYFNIDSSNLIEEQKNLLREKYKNKINSNDELYLSSMAGRSQHANKAAVILRLTNLIVHAIVPPKKRQKTKPTKASIAHRIEMKMRLSEKKANRRKAPDS
ncbi:MAG: alternative ribosome rescue aminoacyl-tRNA hydrolase ArfB [Saprospiraceae bacterium]